MAEKLSLELELLDKVGGPAKRAAAALRGVEEQAKKTKRPMDFSAELARSEAALKKIHMDPKGYRDLLKVQKEISEHRNKIKKSVGGESFMEAFKAKLGFSRLISAGAIGDILAEGFMEGAKKAVEFIADGIKEAFGAIAREQERVAGYDLTLGKKDSREAREQIEKFSGKTAFSASQNQDLMLPLFRAGLSGKAATQAYATSADLAAGAGHGADKNAVAAAVEMFAKIQQRGGLTTKMLTNPQFGLGEKNVPAFFKDLGKTLHVSAEAAKKLAEKPGGVDPQVLMNAITDAVNKMQGGKAGTGAARAGSSLAGQWNKLQALPEEFFNKLVNSPALPKLSAALGNILKQLDPNGPTGQRIMAGLEKAFDTITGWIATALKPENVDKFIDAVGKIPGYLEDAVKVGEVLLTIFAGKKIIDGITGLGTAMGIASAPILAAASAALALLAAYHQISSTAQELGGWRSVGNDLKDFLDPTQKPNELKTTGAANKAGYDEYQEQNRRNLEKAHARQQIVQVNAPVTIHAAPGEDPAHTHQRAGVAVGKHIATELARAQQEGGG